MKGLFFFFVLFATTGFSTFAQVRYGTVGVVYFTQDKIVMAADTRMMSMNTNAPPDDNVCKIAAPNGQIVFVSSGNVGYSNAGLLDLVPSWSNMQEIYRAQSMAANVYSTKHDQIAGTALQWGNLISSDFQELIRWHPELAEQVSQKEKGVITVGIVGGLDESRALILFQTNLTYVGGGFPVAVPFTQQITCPSSYCAIGEIEIEQEFVNLTSKRSHREAKKWKPPKKSQLQDYDILKAMRLVELTIQLHDDDVGGKVNALQMDKDGSVRWFAAENCKQD